MEKLRKAVQIAKIDRENRIVYATLLSPEKPDLQGDLISLPEIGKARIAFMEKYQVVGEMHKREARAQVIDSYVDQTGWTTGTKIYDDEIWNKIDSGEYTGMSVGGYARRDPEADGLHRISDFEVVEYSIVDRPAVPSAVFKAWGEPDADEMLSDLVKAGKVEPRVRSIKQLLADIGKGLIGLVIPAVEGGAVNKEGGVDMTPEEVTALIKQEAGALIDARLAPLNETLANLTKSVEGISAALQPSEPEPEGEPDQSAEEKSLADKLADTEKRLAELTKTVEALPTGASVEKQDTVEDDPAVLKKYQLRRA